MTEQISPTGSTSDMPPMLAPGMTVLADHWGTVLLYGLVTTGLGLTLAVWPGETLVVVAILVSVQLIVTGVLRLVTAVAASSVEPGMRALVGFTGALSLVVGLLCLRDPLQTLVALGLILGVWWVVEGVTDIVGAALSPHNERRIWDVVMGAISVLAGGFLLVKPGLTLGLLVVVACTWLFAYGFFAIVSAIRLRSNRAAGEPVTALPGQV